VVSLQTADDRFMHRIQVIEFGSGYFKGIIDEPQQGSIPVAQFVNGRRVLRVNPETPVKPGMVVKTTGGSVFILAELGDSGEIFKSFRMVETTGKYLWQTRGKVIDAVTGLAGDSGLSAGGLIWGSYEPGTREAFDRQAHVDLETARLVTNQPVRRDEVVDGRRVNRVDAQLGVYVLTLG
jgi:hypothetical protein